jgi:hypothetical protein
MGRVLVVSRNVALSLGLERMGFDVEELRTMFGWHGQNGLPSAVLLDLRDPDHAADAIDLVRKVTSCVPVVVLGRGSDEWRVLGERDGVNVVRSALAPQALAALLSDIAVESPTTEAGHAAALKSPKRATPRPKAGHRLPGRKKHWSNGDESAVATPSRALRDPPVAAPPEPASPEPASPESLGTGDEPQSIAERRAAPTPAPANPTTGAEHNGPADLVKAVDDDAIVDQRAAWRPGPLVTLDTPPVWDAHPDEQRSIEASPPKARGWRSRGRRRSSSDTVASDRLRQITASEAQVSADRADEGVPQPQNAEQTAWLPHDAPAAPEPAEARVTQQPSLTKAASEARAVAEASRRSAKSRVWLRSPNPTALVESTPLQVDQPAGGASVPVEAEPTPSADQPQGEAVADAVEQAADVVVESAETGPPPDLEPVSPPVKAVAEVDADLSSGGPVEADGVEDVAGPSDRVTGSAETSGSPGWRPLRRRAKRASPPPSADSPQGEAVASAVENPPDVLAESVDVLLLEREPDAPPPGSPGLRSRRRRIKQAALPPADSPQGESVAEVVEEPADVVPEAVDVQPPGPELVAPPVPAVESAPGPPDLVNGSAASTKSLGWRPLWRRIQVDAPSDVDALPPTAHGASATDAPPPVLGRDEPVEPQRDAPLGLSVPWPAYSVATATAHAPVNGDAAAAPAPTPVVAPTPAAEAEEATASGERPDALVRELLEERTELYGLHEVATAVLQEAMSLCSADAGAFLACDGLVWYVIAGVGLRPIEERLVLTADHWVVVSTVSRGLAVLVEDSDIVRQRVAGMPLASWQHLLAAPVGDSRGLVILARADEPFTADDVAQISDVAVEATPLLDEALRLRELARALQDFS